MRAASIKLHTAGQGSTKLHTRDAFAQGINPAKIYDAGKTQLEPSTFTEAHG